MGAKGSVGQGKSKCKSSMGAQRAGCPPHPHKPKQAQSGAGGRAQRRSRLFFKKTPRQLDRGEKRAIIRGSAANNAASRQSGSRPCGESLALELKNRVVQTVWVA